ncbi:MAG: hypothetical protein KDK78_11430, partial [Chlamydiia bacterium]|nr:hypothetical protein [Chlamydiia bacterium]
MTEPEWDQMRIGVEQLRSVLLAYVVAHSDEGPEFQSEDVDAFIDAFELSLCQLSEGIRYGYRVIFDEIQHRYHIGQRSDQQLDRFRAKVPDALGQGDLSGLQDLVAAGGLPADYFGFDLATLDEMRSVAAHLLHLRRFEEARNAYYFLIFMCPYSCVLLVGLGEAELGLGHIAESLQCFRIASQMFPTDL